jgi:hypothetical protein
MEYKIVKPLSEQEKQKLLKSPLLGRGEPFIRIFSGHTPTLSEMTETIIWTTKNFKPMDVEFDLDPDYASEAEYSSIFKYLNDLGFVVNKPAAKIIPVPVFDEKKIIAPAVEDKNDSDSNATEPVLGISSYSTQSYYTPVAILVGALFVSAAILVKGK